jgi:hypothetical protein
MTDDVRTTGKAARPSTRTAERWRLYLRVAVLAAVLVLAGCATPFGAGDGMPATGDSDVHTPESFPGANGTASATVPDGETTSPSRAANPWGRETLAVAVVNTAGTWRNGTGHVADALDYWATRQRVGDYEVDFELRPSARDPEVVVRYVEDIATCGSAKGERGAGYAPRISAANPPDPPEHICVRVGYTEGSTRRIVRHEFGHLLGISHGEPPTDLMRPDYPLFEVPRPGPEVLATRFTGGNLTVFVDNTTVYGRRDLIARRQVARAIAFYEGVRVGTQEGPATVTEVADRGLADVVVTFPRQSPCDRTRPGSCAHVETGPGGEPQLVVAITATHEDRFGWHAGFWLGIALGADRHRDLPPAFRNASADDRGGEWWNGGPES